MRIAAIGRTEILYDSILKLKEGGHDIAIIITCKESPGYNTVANDFKLLAEKLKVDFLQTERINSAEVIQQIKNSRSDIAISVNWRTIIQQDVIDCFPYGIINAHVGDLPRYRGNATSNWAIICDEKKIVLTLHLMTPELDAGPIVLQREMPLSDRTYISEIYEFINNNSPDMFLEAIDGFVNDTITLRHQSNDQSISLRCYPRIPKDGEIDWSKPAKEIDRLIRAVSEPFAGAYTYIGTDKLVIWKGHFEIPEYPFVGIPGQVAERRKNKGEVAIVTGEGLIVLEEVSMKSTERKKPTEVIKTIRTRLGMDITGEISRISQELEKFSK